MLALGRGLAGAARGALAALRVGRGAAGAGERRRSRRSRRGAVEGAGRREGPGCAAMGEAGPAVGRTGRAELAGLGGLWVVGPGAA